MGTDAWLTIAVLALILGVLAFTKIAADLVMVGGLTLLLLLGVLEPNEALTGLANEGMVTVGVLFIVVAGLRETGGMAFVARRLFGQPKSVLGAQARMMLPTAGLSGFMNNTPLVAMLIPVVDDWGKKFRIPVSKLMMPLSFATILGGLCTLIGTSTNLVTAGLLTEAIKEGRVTGEGFGMFTLAPIGIPCAIVGITYMLLAGRWLLPDRSPALSRRDDPRQYAVEMIVDAGSPIVGQTIEGAGLRHLEQMFLAEIEREGQIISAVAPTEKIRAGDRLVFIGVVDSVVELQKIRGLRPATNQVFKLDAPRPLRSLIEAVVSSTSPLVGMTIRDARFRNTYNAVVIAVARGGQRLKMKVGDIVVEPGDTLLLEAHRSFVEQHRNSRDFYLINRIEDSSPPRHEKAWIALIILAGMVLTATIWEQQVGMLKAGMVAAGLMILTRCCSVPVARKAVDWQVLILIAAAFGIGRAMAETGAAEAIAHSLMTFAGTNPWVGLAIIYLLTMTFTEILSNNTAAALMFPIAIAAADTMGVHPFPYLVAMTIAASCGFATPIGYQTNLMVYGAGGYHFTDYVRYGGLLNLVVAAVTISITPLVFPFQ
jgi:di/tricarboxylate transporter